MTTLCIQLITKRKICSLIFTCATNVFTFLCAEIVMQLTTGWKPLQYKCVLTSNNETRIVLWQISLVKWGVTVASGIKHWSIGYWFWYLKIDEIHSKTVSHRNCNGQLTHMHLQMHPVVLLVNRVLINQMVANIDHVPTQFGCGTDKNKLQSTHFA